MKRLFFLLLLLVICNVPAHAQSDESCSSDPNGPLCWPVLHRGSRGARVVALQYLLRAKGFRVAPDGVFARATEGAVCCFQTKKKLVVDGRVGFQSWEALTPALKRGARGDAVRALQTLLRYQDYKVARDGVFGAATQRALLKHQQSFGWGEGDKLKGEPRPSDWCYLSGGHLDGE